MGGLTPTPKNTLTRKRARSSRDDTEEAQRQRRRVDDPGHSAIADGETAEDEATDDDDGEVRLLM
jgi:hypothetical protein